MITSRRPAVLALVCALAIMTPLADPMRSASSGSALAQTSGTSEKDAFAAAKDLGTADAWQAFLANYPSGFNADLARAYLKKLAEDAAPPPAMQAQTAQPDNTDFPIAAGSWGGIVRSGPAQSYPKQDSLEEGDNVALMGKTDELDNGYPWFKIWYGPTQKKGYMWGGILCARDVPRSDVFQMCEQGSRAASNDREPPRISSSASFCRQPENDSERAICANSKLSSMDAQLNDEYELPSATSRPKQSAARRPML